MIMTIDKDGNTVNYYTERNKEIKVKLQPALATLVAQKKADLKGQQKFGYRFSVCLDACLRSYGLMSSEEFVKLGYDDLQEIWYNFLDLIAEYNLHFELIANKQLFCSYARINIRQYYQLETSKDDDIKNLMVSLNDFFVGNAFSASESGNASPIAIKQRVTAVGVGHNVVSATDALIVNKLSGEQPTDRELANKVKELTGIDVKLLGEKK